MKPDEILEILKMPKKIQKEIENLELEKHAYSQMVLLSGISYDGVKVKTSPKDRMPEYAARIDSILEKIKERQQAYLIAHDKVISMTAVLTEDEKKIIIQRYLLGTEYDEIAAGFSMSERQMFRLRQEAIKKMQKLS